MKYASVCSGVEAATLAWMPLGWEAAWFSEIEPFPCAVLKERFPNVPNLGDMTKIKLENLENGDQRFTNGLGADVIVSGGVDLLVGGTPCQSFSVAGKREGLEGSSGLAKAFVELLGAMRPRWFVWENVPGCLSSRNKQTGIYDFNFLLAAFAEVGYCCGWRILDAQYCRVDRYPRAVPLRRRRVFVVGHLGAEWEYPAEVLFEPSSLFGNHPPKRIKAKNLTPDVERSVGTASTVRMRAGCEGGGKGALVSNELSLTLAAGANDQTLFTADRSVCFDGMGNESNEIIPTLQACLGKLVNNQNPIILNDQGGNVIVEAVSIAENIIGRQVQNGGNGTGVQEKLAYTQNASGVMGVCTSTVRRLLPIECERLMGFPDNWTRIPWKGKSAEECPDSPRYKACGNSMCVNVMRWIGERIERVERRNKRK